MTEKNYRIHLVGLFAAALLGTGAINLPYGNADRSNVTAFVICFGLVLLAVNIVFCILKPVLLNQNSKIINVIRIIIYAIIILICLYTAQKTFNLFSEFVTERILPYTERYVVAAVFAVTVAFLSLCEDKALFKFSLISFAAFILIIAALFCISFKDFDIENISLLSLPDIKSLTGQTKTYFESMAALILILPAAAILLDIKHSSKSLNIGVVSGFILLLAVLLNSLLVLGTHNAANTEYPYCDAVSTVTLSRLYTRMDGFAYFIYFATELIKVTLCITVIKKILQRLNLKNTSAFTVVMCICLYLICIF